MFTLKNTKINKSNQHARTSSVYDTNKQLPAKTNLQHNLLHFFVRTLKLTNQDQHHFSGVVVGIFGIHEWDKVANSLQKGSKTLELKDDCKLMIFHKATKGKHFEW